MSSVFVCKKDLDESCEYSCYVLLYFALGRQMVDKW